MLQSLPTYEPALRYINLQVSVSCMFALTTGTVSLMRAISSCLIHPLTAVPVADHTCATLRLTLATRLSGWPSRSDGLEQSVCPCDWLRPAEWRDERTVASCRIEERKNSSKLQNGGTTEQQQAAELSNVRTAASSVSVVDKRQVHDAIRPQGT